MNGLEKRLFRGSFKYLLYAIGCYWVFGIIPAVLFGLLFFGALLNLIVVLVNGGKMPVLFKPEWREMIPEWDNEHCWMTSKSRLKFLADRFRLSDRSGISSLGDLIIGIASELLMVYIYLVVVIFAIDSLLKNFAR